MRIMQKCLPANYSRRKYKCLHVAMGLPFPDQKCPRLFVVHLKTRGSISE